MPGELGVIGIPASDRDGCAYRVLDRVRVVEDVDRLVLDDDVRDLRIDGLVGLFEGSGPLQPERFLGFPLGGNSPDLGVGQTAWAHEQKNRCASGRLVESPA